MTTNNMVPNEQPTGGATKRANYSRRTPDQIEADNKLKALETLDITQDQLDILKLVLDGQPIAGQTQAPIAEPVVPAVPMMPTQTNGFEFDYGMGGKFKLSNMDEHGKVICTPRIHISGSGNVALNTAKNGPLMVIEGTDFLLGFMSATIWSTKVGRWMKPEDFTRSEWEYLTGKAS